MASWMVHLRVADKLLNRISGITSTEFVIGNIAPDSGIPNEDQSAFTPSSEVSHFRTSDEDGIKVIHEDWYIEKYFTKEQREFYDTKQYSFYLGYLIHLLTDKLWVRDVVQPLRMRNLKLYEQNRGEWFRAIKKEWRILDLIYLQRHADFRSFMICEQAIGFQNTFLDFFRQMHLITEGNTLQNHIVKNVVLLKIRQCFLRKMILSGLWRMLRMKL